MVLFISVSAVNTTPRDSCSTEADLKKHYVESGEKVRGMNLSLPQHAEAPRNLSGSGLLLAAPHPTPLLH